LKYICANCEAEFLGWSGKCPSCNAWGTLEEVEDTPKNLKLKANKQSGEGGQSQYASAEYIPLKSIKSKTDITNRI